MSDVIELIFSATTVILEEESESPEDEEEIVSDSVASLPVTASELKESEVKEVVVDSLGIVNVTVVTGMGDAEAMLDFPVITGPTRFPLFKEIAGNTGFPPSTSSDAVVADVN